MFFPVLLNKLKRGKKTVKHCSIIWILLFSNFVFSKQFIFINDQFQESDVLVLAPKETFVVCWYSQTPSAISPMLFADINQYLERLKANFPTEGGIHIFPVMMKAISFNRINIFFENKSSQSLQLQIVREEHHRLVMKTRFLLTLKEMDETEDWILVERE